MTSPSIRVLLADDHAIVREGLRLLLTEVPQIEVVAEASNGMEAVQMAQQHRPAVVLMDLVMPELNGVEATRQIMHQQPDCRILVLTSFADDRYVTDAIQAGALGYLLKDIVQPDLVRAIHDAVAGRPTLHPEAQQHLIRRMVGNASVDPFQQLTERERDVLILIAKGHSNKAIAAHLHLTEGTVKGYVSAVLGKLNVTDRTQAALYAVRHGLVGND